MKRSYFLSIDAWVVGKPSNFLSGIFDFDIREIGLNDVVSSRIDAVLRKSDDEEWKFKVISFNEIPSDNISAPDSPITPPIGESMPQTREHWEKRAQNDQELILEQKSEISELKHKCSVLGSKLDSASRYRVNHLIRLNKKIKDLEDRLSICAESRTASSVIENIAVVDKKGSVGETGGEPVNELNYLNFILAGKDDTISVLNKKIKDTEVQVAIQCIKHVDAMKRNAELVSERDELKFEAEERDSEILQLKHDIDGFNRSMSLKLVRLEQLKMNPAYDRVLIMCNIYSSLQESRGGRSLKFKPDPTISSVSAFIAHHFNCFD